MNLEQWIIDLLNSIKDANTMGAGFELRLDSDAVKAIASAYETTDWIELY